MQQKNSVQECYYLVPLVALQYTDVAEPAGRGNLK